MQSRRSGILLAISSLPGEHGSGDLGPAAFSTLRLFSDLGITLWQTLPVNRTDGFGCPYSSPSAFGCEPALLSLDWFFQKGLLSDSESGGSKANGLRAAFENFKRGRGTPELRTGFTAFFERHRDWLVPLSRFLKDDTQEFQPFLEFAFREQWAAFRRRAEELGIRLVGDVPIFVSYDGVDVQTHPEQFKLDHEGHPVVVAGVPPDEFSRMGQNWGSPVYNWEAMAATGWQWWRQRLALQFELFHTVRLDHFRGFAAAWEIPAKSGDARNGQWVEGGGKRLLEALRMESPDADGLIAEDLGVITPDVDDLRDHFRLPTMKIQQFHWQETFPSHCVAYTGTHDNDTIWGWHQSLNQETKKSLHRYLGITDWRTERSKFVPRMIEDLFARAADWCIVPAQDVLQLGSEGRMNIPGTVGGNNWRWRLQSEQLKIEDWRWFGDLISGSGR